MIIGSTICCQAFLTFLKALSKPMQKWARSFVKLIMSFCRVENLKIISNHLLPLLLLGSMYFWDRCICVVVGSIFIDWPNFSLKLKIEICLNDAWTNQNFPLPTFPNQCLKIVLPNLCLGFQIFVHCLPSTSSCVSVKQVSTKHSDKGPPSNKIVGH